MCPNTLGRCARPVLTVLLALASAALSVGCSSKAPQPPPAAAKAPSAVTPAPAPAAIAPRPTPAPAATPAAAPAATPVATPAPVAPAVPRESPAHAPGYELAFHDEFDGSSLNEQAWLYRTGERFWSTQLPANVSVRDGCLRLALKKEATPKSAYTAGGVISRQAHHFGYYEARMKSPPGAGWHTSFWLMRHNAPRTAGEEGQEIDIVEHDSIHPHMYTLNLHRWPKPAKPAAGAKPVPSSIGGKPVTSPTLLSEFNTYGCEFLPGKLRFFLNGKLVKEVDSSPYPQERVQIWLTSIASPLGGTKAVDDSKLPAEAVFDYVRFYAPKAGTKAAP